MEVSVNKNLKEIPMGASLLNALDGFVELNTKGIAVAVNNTVIQKAKWEQFVLQEGDNIIVIKATQGG